MNGRTTIALAVLAGVGLTATESGRDALDAVLSKAQAQQAGESERQAEAPDRQTDRDRQTRERGDAQGESEIARAAGAGAEMHVMGIQVERGEHGPHLTDQDGRALYLLESESNGESQCYDQCAEEWPPALIEQGQMPETEGRRIDEELLGTLERRDGSTQITYGDYPLYYYYRDEAPGDVTGHDVHDEWGGWYLVTPDGEPLESEGLGGEERG